MPPLPCCHLRTLRHSSVLMAGAKRLSARCSVAGNVAPLPFSSFTSYSSSSHLLLRLRTYIHFAPLKRPTSKSLVHSQKSARSYTSYSPVVSDTVSQPQDAENLVQRVAKLKAKLQNERINAVSCKPGVYNRMLCPECQGGSTQERSLSVFIREDGEMAFWRCFRAKCRWKGCVNASSNVNKREVTTQAASQNDYRVITEEELKLKPLCEEPQDAKDLVQRVAELKAKLQKEGITAVSYKPGIYSKLLCPECQGRSTQGMSLSVFIRKDGEMAFWTCFKTKCGWKGHVNASGDVNKHKVTTQAASQKDYRVITEEELKLEPLCEELIDYFSERMIRRKTLVRNGIMQVKKNDEIVIAFPYRRNGSLVSCKYRTVAKKFFQEAYCEQIFYGLDDIKNAEDIIIVEGEIDKLSMEEAGYCNCISVPNGAPSKVSKELPDAKMGTKFQFIWNCKEHIEKASRIIIATDADTPGQALAEELARRFGKERCWRVKWPNKSDTEVCKDANEVLMYLGPNALKQVVDDAELYPI